MRRKLRRKIERTLGNIAQRLATRDLRAVHDGPHLLSQFLSRCRALHAPRVLGLGTKRSVESQRTRHDEWIPHASEYLGSDIAPGVDVDIVADIHRLTRVTGEEQFDVIISSSSFEHFKYPHLAAHEIMKSLRIGGLLFVQTHQSFPLHAYPYDYFRFSREAMSGLFGTKMGFNVIATGYEFPVKLYSREVPASRDLPAYLNVVLYGEKTAPTPREYIYEYDVPDQ
jgi:SAM-dependent methyltransferase